MTKVKAICIAACFFIIGCATYNEGLIVDDKVGYIKLNGDLDNAHIILDGNNTLTDIDSSALYRIPPGKHRITIKKLGVLVVDKVFIVGNGSTKTIEVP